MYQQFKEKARKYYIEILVVVMIGICFYSIKLYYDNFANEGISGNTSNWGTFGDYIGGVLGTILSFFSVVLIYATYKNQVRTSSLQQFETTFFNLINNQRQIIQSLKDEIEIDFFMNEFKEVSKEEYISTIATLINRHFDGRTTTMVDKHGKEYLFNSDDNKELKNIIDRTYKWVYTGREAELGHYFRHLYHIFKYTDESSINNKKKYIDILQAQMSDDELYITFYNGLSEFGYTKFHPLLDKYSFFENIRSRGPLFNKHSQTFYPKTKFKHQ